jgi:hypothetical protein
MSADRRVMKAATLLAFLTERWARRAASRRFYEGLALLLRSQL